MTLDLHGRREAQTIGAEATVAMVDEAYERPAEFDLRARADALALHGGARHSAAGRHRDSSIGEATLDVARDGLRPIDFQPYVGIDIAARLERIAEAVIKPGGRLVQLDFDADQAVIENIEVTAEAHTIGDAIERVGGAVCDTLIRSWPVTTAICPPAPLTGSLLRFCANAGAETVTASATKRNRTFIELPPNLGSGHCGR